MKRSEDKWLRIAREGTVLARQRAANDLDCSPAALGEMAASNVYGIVRNVANNPNTPKSTLRYLFDSGDVHWKVMVADNPSASKTLLQLAAEHEDSGVRKAAAGNPSCPTQLLESLAINDADTTVRNASMLNPSLPSSSIASLAVVHPAAAANINCPPQTLEALLVNDATPADIKTAAIGNDSTPIEALRQYVRTCNASGQTPDWAALIQHDACPSDFLDAGLKHLRNTDVWNDTVYVAKFTMHDNIGPETLRYILDSPELFNPWEQADALLHPICPSDILGRIAATPLSRPHRATGHSDDDYADDGELLQQLSAVQNENCPPEALAKIVTARNTEDYSFAVQAAAYNNPNLPNKIRKKARSWPYLCSRWEATRRRWRFGKYNEWGGATDKDPYTVYEAETAWAREMPAQENVRTLRTATSLLSLLQGVMDDPELQERYPHIAGWGEQDVSITVLDELIDSNGKKVGGWYELVSGDIKITTERATEDMALHEFAHKIVEEDPRYQRPPLPAPHGPEFTSAMLDLVEVRYGTEAREDLRNHYRRFKAPLDRRDSPLNANSTTGITVTPAATSSNANSTTGITVTPAATSSNANSTTGITVAPAATSSKSGRAGVCGHPLGKGRTCRHKVSRRSKRCAAGHPRRS